VSIAQNHPSNLELAAERLSTIDIEAQDRDAGPDCGARLVGVEEDLLGDDSTGGREADRFELGMNSLLGEFCRDALAPFTLEPVFVEPDKTAADAHQKEGARSNDEGLEVLEPTELQHGRTSLPSHGSENRRSVQKNLAPGLGSSRSETEN
jgi:hypothetical protein